MWVSEKCVRSSLRKVSSNAFKATENKNLYEWETYISIVDNEYFSLA